MIQNGWSLITIYCPAVCLHRNEKCSPKFVKDTNLLQDPNFFRKNNQELGRLAPDGTLTLIIWDGMRVAVFGLAFLKLGRVYVIASILDSHPLHSRNPVA